MVLRSFSAALLKRTTHSDTASCFFCSPMKQTSARPGSQYGCFGWLPGKSGSMPFCNWLPRLPRTGASEIEMRFDCMGAFDVFVDWCQEAKGQNRSGNSPSDRIGILAIIVQFGEAVIWLCREEFEDLTDISVLRNSRIVWYSVVTTYSCIKIICIFRKSIRLICVPNLGVQKHPAIDCV